MSTTRQPAKTPNRLRDVNQAKLTPDSLVGSYSLGPSDRTG